MVQTTRFFTRFMGRWLMALLLVMLSSLATKAAEAYACYTSSNSTLTFYYDDLRSSRTGRTYDLNTGSNDPGWYTDNTYSSIKKVVFNSSFANARPTSTYRWFSMTESITGISNLNTEDVTNMSFMFNSCYHLTTLDVSHFNTANVTSMYGMFFSCRELTSLDLSNFNTSKVTDMHNMFHDCSGLTSLDVSNFNTSKVTDMRYMFYRCSSLTSLDVTQFNTTNVTRMSCMFYGCSSLTSLDLSNFNTVNVTNMFGMFNGCSDLTTIYAGSDWTTNAVTTSTGMFENCTSLVGGMGTTYDANHVDAAYAHIDGGPANPGYLSEPVVEAYACYTPSNTTLTFYYDNQRGSRPGTTYDLNEGSNEPGWYNDLYDQSTNYLPITRVVFDPSFANARPTSTYCWFSAMEDVESIEGLEYLNTSEVTNMGYMFSECRSLTSLDLSNFNTAKVTNMEGMFYYSWGLMKLDLSSFNTAKVTDMGFMFSQCRDLTSLDLSNFNTAKVTDMGYMFYGCMSLTSLDVSSFDTAKVTDMGYMFYGCMWLTSLDVSSFNTAKVTNMKSMFKDCNYLTYIYADNGWSTAAVTSSDFMFDDCFSLVGGMGTTYDENHVDATRAHIDGGPSNPGYFTDVNAPRAYACYTPGNTTLTFYYDNQCSSRPGTTYDLVNVTPGWFRDLYDESTSSLPMTRVVFDPSFAGARPTSTYGWFTLMQSLESIEGIEYLNTSEVTSMSFMFYWCFGLTSLDLSNFNTSNVTTMADMFDGCYRLTSLDLSSFSTAAVTDMSDMFTSCESLTTIYAGSGWSTAAVTSSDLMFDDCINLVGGMGTTYDENHVNAARAHIDGGPSNPGYFTAKSSFLRGDVNGDGQVKIGDVTALINYLLSGDALGINLQAADCDQNGEIKIGDVTALINYLLSGSWN